ncbi:MAG: cobalt ECF transporter T component CbiQ [Thermoleophilia bacterium]
MTPASGNSDSYTWGDGFLSRIDPRIKIGAIAGLLLINLLAASYLVSGTIALTMVLLMIAGRIPYRRQLLMIAFPSTFAVFAVVSQTLFKGNDVFASLGPFDLHLDGLLHGLFLSLRIIAGGLIVVMLGATTPLNRLCLALRWFRISATFVEVVQLTYRYLFDIHAEFTRMREAQRSRLGWSSTGTGLASSRMLGGSLFLRVYERGLRSSEAMRCRGSGAVVNGTLTSPGRIDLIAAISMIALLGILTTMSIAGAP